MARPAPNQRGILRDQRRVAQIDSSRRRVLASPGLYRLTFDNNQSGNQSGDDIRRDVKRRGLARTWIEYAAAWTILKIVSLAPRAFALKAGQIVGALAYTVLPRLRRHAEINLRLAFPDIDEREVTHTTGGSSDQRASKWRIGETVPNDGAAPEQLQLSRGHRIECHNEIMQAART